jgi:TolB protein
MDSDGRGKRQLTDTDEDNDPRWSPDGSKIVLTTLSRQEIVIMNADGTGRQTIYEVPDPVNNIYWEAKSPTWSPDGSQIAFCQVGNIVNPPSSHPSIKVVAATGGEATTLADSGANPDWSPDGTRIAYNSDGIWVMNSDGSNKQKLMEEGWNPRWSPDGSKIAFAQSPELFVDGIHTMKPDGTGITLVITGTGDIYDLAWSPDGRYIVFDFEPEFEPYGDTDVWTVDLVTGEARRLTDDQESHAPDWRWQAPSPPPGDGYL